MSELKRYYGKYRGTVINNVDPMQIGRIQAMVPDVAALLPSSWAMPCIPVAGIYMVVHLAYRLVGLVSGRIAPRSGTPW